MNRIVSLVNDSFNNLTTIPKYFLATAAIANLPYIRDLLILPKIVALAWSPWTILTNMLVGRVLLLPASVVFILFSLKYFENVWGKPELIKYLLVTALVSQILLIVLIIVCSFFVGGQLLFTPVFGFTSAIFGYLVAYKQLVPEHRILVAGFISFRTKVLPIMALSVIACIVTVMGLVESDPYPIFYYFFIMYLQGWSGTLSAWGYLRFYQRRDGILGDRSETFSILSFFPESWHKWMSPISNSVFELAVRMKIIPGISRYAPLDNSQDNSDEMPRNVNLNPPEIFSEEADAERRRALGLKALESRLAQQ